MMANNHDSDLCLVTSEEPGYRQSPSRQIPSPLVRSIHLNPLRAGEWWNRSIPERCLIYQEECSISNLVPVSQNHFSEIIDQPVIIIMDSVTLNCILKSQAVLSVSGEGGAHCVVSIAP
jgi:hypothetical protein